MPRIFGALYKDFDSLKFVGNNLKLKKKKKGEKKLRHGSRLGIDQTAVS